MVLANRPVKGMDELEARFGKIHFLIPTAVIKELDKLASSAGVKRAKEAKLTLDLISKFKTIRMDSVVADDAIMDYVSRRKCMVATIDNELKNKLQRNGVSVVTLSKNKLIVV